MRDRWTIMLDKDASKGAETDSGAQSDAKYSVLHHPGLEVVDLDHAPEVVPGSSPNLNRKSSLSQPEAYHAAPYYSDKPEHHSYYEAPQTLRPESEGLQPLDSRDGEEGLVTEQGVNGRQEQRQCFGMRRGIFIAVAVTIALLVCIGIILGAVLGTLLPKKWAKETAGDLQVMSGTGLASTLAEDGSGRLLTYFQDTDGRIIEISYLDGTWTLQNRINVNLSVVTSEASYGSQLAAISYKLSGKTYRQVFFTTSTGAVMTVNSTETTDGIASDWSAGRPITYDRIDPKGLGLAACWSDKTMNGIRAFYPSQYGYIQEMKWTFGEDSWRNGEQITSSDSKFGFGCAVKDNTKDQYLNLYYRSTASGKVKQAFVEYKGHPFWSYEDGPTAGTNRTIATGSDIAVCNDQSQTEYVYYQQQGGLVTRGVVNPTSKDYELFENMQGATPGSKFSCSFVNGGSMLLFQNRTSTSTIWASDVSRSGVSISNFAVP